MKGADFTRKQSDTPLKEGWVIRNNKKCLILIMVVHWKCYQRLGNSLSAWWWKANNKYSLLSLHTVAVTELLNQRSMVCSFVHYAQTAEDVDTPVEWRRILPKYFGLCFSKTNRSCNSKNIQQQKTSRKLCYRKDDRAMPAIRLTDGEIILEEFQPMWSQSTNVTDGRADRQCRATEHPEFWGGEDARGTTINQTANR